MTSILSLLSDKRLSLISQRCRAGQYSTHRRQILQKKSQEKEEKEERRRKVCMSNDNYECVVNPTANFNILNIIILNCLNKKNNSEY